MQMANRSLKDNWSWPLSVETIWTSMALKFSKIQLWQWCVRHVRFTIFHSLVGRNVVSNAFGSFRNVWSYRQLLQQHVKLKLQSSASPDLKGLQSHQMRKRNRNTCSHICLLQSGASTAWHTERVKIGMFEMVQSRLVESLQCHLTLHIQRQLDQMVMFKTLTRWLHWSWWILPPTTLDVSPSRGRMTLQWWPERSCNSHRCLVMLSATTCVTMNHRYDRCKSVQCAPDNSWDLQHTARLLQHTHMETACVRTRWDEWEP